MGHFYKYDSILDRNLLVKEGVFLVLDRIKSPNGQAGGRYVINIVDPAGTLSFTHCEITGDRMMELIKKDQTLMWVGDIRKTGEIPAWCFYIT